MAAPTTTRTTTYLPLDKVRIVDIGDADIVHTDTAASHANTETAVRKILERGALPVVLGGDHSINIPCVRAFSEHGPIHIVQIDAHLDFVDERHGVRYGHGNPMRRAAEKSHVSGLSADRHPQRLLDGPRRLRGRAPARLDDPVGAPGPQARRRRRSGAASRRARATT